MFDTLVITCLCALGLVVMVFALAVCKQAKRGDQKAEEHLG